MIAKLIKTRKRYKLEDRDLGVVASGTKEQVEAIAKARGILVLYPAWGPDGKTAWVTIPAN
jgi:hypothetical protein